MAERPPGPEVGKVELRVGQPINLSNGWAMLADYNVSNGRIQNLDVLESMTYHDLWIYRDVPVFDVHPESGPSYGLFPQAAPRKIEPGEMFVVVSTANLKGEDAPENEDNVITDRPK